ncbi:MAG: DUF1214 domain-containing protein [Beijerinckiaceae bacterium]
MRIVDLEFNKKASLIDDLSALKVFVVLVSSCLFGLGSAWLTIDLHSGFGSVEIGEWRTHPRVGYYNIDPYARAAIIRRGEMPLGIGEGIQFISSRDVSGLPLNSQCNYRVSGTLPIARAWTLAVQKIDGNLFKSLNESNYLTSRSIVNSKNEIVTIFASVDVQSGNWLSLPPDSAFNLVFRFYDVSANINSSATQRADLPRVERISCQHY